MYIYIKKYEFNNKNRLRLFNKLRYLSIWSGFDSQNASIFKGV